MGGVPGGGFGSGKRGLSFRLLGNGRHFAGLLARGLLAPEACALAVAARATAILARVVSWPARGTHATCTLDGLTRLPFAVYAVNSSDRSPAVTATSPAAVAVTGGAEPDAVSVRGPLRERAVVGDLRSRQIAGACLVPSVTLVLRLAVSVTVAAFRPARWVTAARARVTATPVVVGRIGWPAVPAAGNVAVTSVLTGREAEENAQV
jgi:hypothetical protein